MTSRESGLNFASEERLVLAILRQAILDLISKPRGALGSVKWFNDVPLSTYRLCTTVLDVDPTDFRKRIAHYVGLELNPSGYIIESSIINVDCEAVRELAHTVFNIEHAPQIATHGIEIDEII